MKRGKMEELFNSIAAMFLEMKIYSRIGFNNATEIDRRLMEISKTIGVKYTIVMNEEDYSGGYIGIDPALYKSNGCVSQVAWNRLIKKEMLDMGKAIDIRTELREEYRQKVKNGEIRPYTSDESTIRNANGHEKRDDVQAARKVCEILGLEWNYEKATNGEKYVELWNEFRV